MIDTQLYFGTDELDGTMYYEYQPGAAARWRRSSTSVYLSEGVQSTIEYLCTHFLQNYNPWGTTRLYASSSAPFIDALRAYSSMPFQRAFLPPFSDEKACKELIVTYAKLATWLEHTFESHDGVTLFGL